MITDIKLPGMDGVRFISQIREKYPDLHTGDPRDYPDMPTFKPPLTC